MTDDSLQRIAAFHEAGHAVAAITFHWPIARISIAPNETSLASVEAPNLLARIEDKRSAKYRRACINGMIISLAGPAAQYAAYPQYEAFAGADDDLLNAEAFASEFASVTGTRAPTRQIVNAGWQRACKLVHRRRRAVGRVAQTLLERETLDAAQLFALTSLRRHAQGSKSTSQLPSIVVGSRRYS